MDMRAIRHVLAAAVAAAGALAYPGDMVAQDDETCLMCHADASLFAGLEDPSRLVVTREEYQGSVHGQLGLSCVGCHQGVAVPHGDSIPSVNCGACHGSVQESYDGSLHGYALARGNPRAPTCASCHGTHNILSSVDPRSQTHKVRMPATCAGCHGTAGLLTDQIVKLPQSFTAYAQSVHGQGTGRGIAAAASCADCHSVHELRGAADPQSRINPRNVASTCGQCHPDIQLEYDRSIHGRALQAGVTDSPTCTDCHGEHLILSPRDPNASTYAAREAVETCGRCHDDPLIISKYNLESGVVGTYVDSYHGWATRRTAGLAATCDDCHTAHLVLPAEDPASSVHVDNVVATCAACHPGAGQEFAASYTHARVSAAVNPVNRIIRNIYLLAIAFIIGLMVLHNLVIMNYYMIESRRAQEVHSWVMRFDLHQILQHLLLTVAFVVLVVTGFALRFPDAWWVVGLANLGMNEVLRGDIHRAAGVLLIATSVYHAWYVLATKRGRRELKAFAPRWSDVTDLVLSTSGCPAGPLVVGEILVHDGSTPVEHSPWGSIKSRYR